jgi:hypothetical protein
MSDADRLRTFRGKACQLSHAIAAFLGDVRHLNPTTGAPHLPGDVRKALSAIDAEELKDLPPNYHPIAEGVRTISGVCDALMRKAPLPDWPKALGDAIWAIRETARAIEDAEDAQHFEQLARRDQARGSAPGTTVEARPDQQAAEQSSPTTQGDEVPLAPVGAERRSGAINLFHLDDEVWRIQYEKDEKPRTFQDRHDSALRHCARLLASPHKKLIPEEFFPPPPGGGRLPSYGRDADSDDQAMSEYEKDLRRMASEIKEAKDAHDHETADRLGEEFKALATRVESEKAARKLGHKKLCGTESPREKADHTLDVALRRLKDRFREKGLPKLADHLDSYIRHEQGNWWYEPPSETAPWHVIISDPSSKKN